METFSWSWVQFTSKAHQALKRWLMFSLGFCFVSVLYGPGSFGKTFVFVFVGVGCCGCGLLCAGAGAAVSILLGVSHATGVVERYLRTLALNYDQIGRMKLTPQTLSEVMLVDVHAPLASQVGTRVGGGVRPKGQFLSRMCASYPRLFGGRRFRKQPKPRRDKGILRSRVKLVAQRKRRGDSMPEAEFLWRREECVSAATQLNPEERERKRQKSVFGVPVPQPDSNFVTSAVENVRRKAAARGAKKNATILSFAERANAKHSNTTTPEGQRASRWVSRRSCVDSAGSSKDGKTSCSKALASKSGPSFVVYEDNCECKDRLMRRGFDVYKQSRWRKFVVAAMGAPKVKPKIGACMFVAEALSEESWNSSRIYWAARVCGGFLTVDKWVMEALQGSSSPRGVLFKGILAARRVVWLSPGVAVNRRQFCDVVRSLSELPGERLQLVGTLDRLQEVCSKYMEKRGQTSRPWTSIHALAQDNLLGSFVRMRKFLLGISGARVTVAGGVFFFGWRGLCFYVGAGGVVSGWWSLDNFGWMERGVVCGGSDWRSWRLKL